MRIAVDVDGVLAERVPSLLDLIDARYGTRLEKRDVTGWDATVSATGKRLTDFFAETDRDPDHVLGLSPVAGAIEGMNALAGDHEVWIATYRDPDAYEPTAKWLDAHGIPFRGIVDDPGEGKTNVDADVLIDDSAPTVRAFARERGHAVLFRQPWNAAESLPANAHAVENWTEAVRHVSSRRSVR